MTGRKGKTETVEPPDGKKPRSRTRRETDTGEKAARLRPDNDMTFWKKYWKARWLPIAAFVLFGLIFLTVFALYRLPLEALLYACALCALLGAGLLAADFVRTRKKHRLLCRILSLSAFLPEELPPAADVTEEDYQAVLRLLDEQKRSAETVMELRYRDMVEYYTVWVHQIKTPIASMRLTLQEEDSERSRRLSADLFRIEQYVEMVLAFLRLDSVQSDYVIRSCDLDAIVRQCIKKFAGEFIARRIRLEYETVDMQTVTDEKWLSFVIEQLLSNALKYTPHGSIRIAMESPGVLCIRDTGIGIAPEDLPRIFEKGYTGYNGRRDRRASGIGLYLCRRICRNLGHEISVTSVPGQGTAVCLDLNRHASRLE